MEITRKEGYLEVDYLRAIAVILLVIWHCFFCPMFVWGVVEPQADMNLLKLVAKFMIVDATMPLFTFISGYLFTALYVEKQKYRSFLPFLKNKVNRLIVPFLVFSVLIISTSYNMDFKSMVWGEGCHMWYCAMLFWCFMIAWALLRLNNKIVSWFIIGISIVLVFANPNFWYLPFQFPFGLDNGLYYYSYFALGGAFFCIRTSLKILMLELFGSYMQYCFLLT